MNRSGRARQVKCPEILELGNDGRYTHALDASGGRIEEVPGCGGLMLDLDALWIEVERLADEQAD